MIEVILDKFDYPWRLNKQLVIGRALARSLTIANKGVF